MTNREIFPLNGTSVWNHGAEVPGVLQILNGAPGFSRAHASGEGQIVPLWEKFQNVAGSLWR